MRKGKLNQGVEEAFIGLVCLEGDQCHKGSGMVWQAGCSEPEGTQTAGGQMWRTVMMEWEAGHTRSSLPASHLKYLRWMGEPSNEFHSFMRSSYPVLQWNHLRGLAGCSHFIHSCFICSPIHSMIPQSLLLSNDNDNTDYQI